MKNKYLGILLLIISGFVLASLIIYNIQVKGLISELMINSGGSCLIKGVCVHERSLLPLYIGSISFGILLIIGLFLIFYEKPKEEVMQEGMQKKKIHIPENLDEEEKKIIEILNSKEGSVYQSDLIKETSYSKVKITRILDKLEQKKLIDRKRRGMTNIIVLK